MDRIIHPPIPIIKDVSGLTFPVTNPLGYNIDMPHYADFLNLMPGLSIKNDATPVDLGVQMGMRIYNGRWTNSLTWVQGYPPCNLQLIHTAKCDGERLIPWKHMVKLFIEFYTLFTTALPSGSRIELTIQPFSERG